MANDAEGITPISARHESLAFGVPSASRGTIHALALTGGVAARPSEGQVVRFGRNRPDVHVCVGEDDLRVSRCHGEIDYRSGTWWLNATGRTPIRLPGTGMVFRGDEPLPLADGYTPVFIAGSRSREHLMELYVAGPQDTRRPARPNAPTQPPRTWRLSPREKIALVVLGQRYLLQEPHPQPLSWRQAAEQLAELQPELGWTAKTVEHVVVAVRSRLSAGGVSGLTRDEVGEPIGNSLNHNLLRELVQSTTLVPPDIRMLDLDDEGC